MSKPKSILVVTACLALYGLAAGSLAFGLAWACREYEVSRLSTFIVLCAAFGLIAPLTRAYLNWVNRVIGSTDRV